uniref:Secreted protein n=1 Tax=Cacopsylla melanoneura TaxID=428564 RepID=A0A8D8YFM5_9HEMI
MGFFFVFFFFKICLQSGLRMRLPDMFHRGALPSSVFCGWPVGTALRQFWASACYCLRLSWPSRFGHQKALGLQVSFGRLFGPSDVIGPSDVNWPSAVKRPPAFFFFFFIILV